MSGRGLAQAGITDLLLGESIIEVRMVDAALDAADSSGPAVTLEGAGEKPLGLFVIRIDQLLFQIRDPSMPETCVLAFFRYAVELPPLEGVVKCLPQIVAQMAPDKAPGAEALSGTVLLALFAVVEGKGHVLDTFGDILVAAFVVWEFTRHQDHESQQRDAIIVLLTGI